MGSMELTCKGIPLSACDSSVTEKSSYVDSSVIAGPKLYQLGTSAPEVKTGLGKKGGTRDIIPTSVVVGVIEEGLRIKCLSPKSEQ